MMVSEPPFVFSGLVPGIPREAASLAPLAFGPSVFLVAEPRPGTREIFGSAIRLEHGNPKMTEAAAGSEHDGGSSFPARVKGARLTLGLRRRLEPFILGLEKAPCMGEGGTVMKGEHAGSLILVGIDVLRTSVQDPVVWTCKSSCV